MAAAAHSNDASQSNRPWTAAMIMDEHAAITLELKSRRRTRCPGRRARQSRRTTRIGAACRRSSSREKLQARGGSPEARGGSPELGAQPRAPEALGGRGRRPRASPRTGAGAPGGEDRGEPRAGKTGAGDRRGGGDGPAPRECQAAGRAMRGWRGGASSGRRLVRDPAPAARGELGQVAGSGPSAGSTTARRARLGGSRVRSADDPPSWATRPHRWPSSLRSSQAPGQVRRRGSTSAVAEAPRFARRGVIRASHPGQRPA